MATAGTAGSPDRLLKSEVVYLKRRVARLEEENERLKTLARDSKIKFQAIEAELKSRLSLSQSSTQLSVYESSEEEEGDTEPEPTLSSPSSSMPVSLADDPAPQVGPSSSSTTASSKTVLPSLPVAKYLERRYNVPQPLGILVCLVALAEELCLHVHVSLEQ
ncbi:SKN1-domain-containing protein [Pseudohyphozyma bogoriensis]|nr:SKN1-domain-containing protein [Pseudohyphozyma bogoriensis]